MIYEVQEESGQKKLNALAGKATTGIPLGTWLAFENDSAPNIEWIRAGTTFDVNAYPALAMYLGSDKVPERFDHSRCESYPSIRLIGSGTRSGYTTATLTQNYELEYDGLVTVITDYNTLTVTVTTPEGTEYALTYGGHQPDDKAIPIELKKGSKIKYSRSSQADFLLIQYYKHPLFIKATPTSSNSDYEGTLNAVRQYVTNSNSYSEEEVWTGGYWIDGKKIYRKTWKRTDLQNFVVGIASTLSAITHLEFWYKNNTGAWHNNNYSNYSNYFLGAYYDQTDDTFKYYGQNVICNEAYVVIEYTKTTD